MDRDQDRADLAERFLELALRGRRDHLLLIAAGAFVSIVVAAGLSVVVYVLLGYYMLRGAIPSYAAFLPFYALAFIVAGYAEHRRALKSEFTDDEEDLRYSVPGILQCFGLIVPMWRFCVRIPALPFLLLHEAIEGRHAFASRDAIDVAFEIITLGDDKVPLDAVREKLRSDPVATRRALFLLRDMGFVLLRRRGGEPSIVKTMRALDFLENNLARCNP